jgi:hypothetical protein
MADNSVFITGIADGAIEEALGDLPQWATQSTAESIEGILQKTLSLQTKALSQLVKKATSGDGSLDAKEVNDEFAKLVKNFKEENAQNQKDNKFNKDKNDQNKKDKKYWDEDKSNKAVQAAMYEALAKASTRIEQSFSDNITTFDNLNAAGIDVMNGMAANRDGFESLRDITALTGVRFTELAGAMTKYSSAVNSFGVGKFAKTVGMASSNLTQFGFSSKESAELLGEMLSMQQNTGDVSQKTAEQTNKDLQHFGDSVFKLSLATGMDRAKLIEHAASLSQSTEANLLAGQIGQEAAGDMTTFLASFKNQDIAKQLLKLMSDPIKPLNESFMNLQKVGMGGFAQTFTKFTQSLKDMPEEQRSNAYKAFMDSHRQEIDQQKQRLALLAQAGSAEAKASLDYIVGLQQQADATKVVSEEDIKRQKASNEASKDFANAMEKFKSIIQRMFGPTTAILNIATGVLTIFNTIMDVVIGTLDWVGSSIWAAWHAIIHPVEAATSIMEAFDKALQKVLHPIDTFTEIMTYLSENFKTAIDMLMHPIDTLETAFTKLDETLSGGIDLTAWLGVAAIGVGMLAGAKGFKKLLNMFSGGDVKKNIAEKASGSAGKAGGGLLGGLGKGLAGLGKGIAGLGKGIGGAVGGMLKGLASGLEALGKPKVLLGVVALAGMAGVLWLTGKALKEFISLDWKQLELAGAAIVGLGLAGALAGKMAGDIIMGAIALAFMGGALWVVGKSLQEFLKLDWKQLEIAGAALVGIGLAGAGLGLLLPEMLMGAAGLAALGASLWVVGKAIGTVGDGITTISSGLSNLSNTLGSFKGLDNLKTLVSTINDLEITKALALAALSVTGIGTGKATPPTNVSTGTAPKSSTLNSPSAVSADPNVGGDQSTPKDAQAASSGGAEKPVTGSGLETALGYQSSILQQLLESNNSLISINKDILKYTKVNA